MEAELGIGARAGVSATRPAIVHTQPGEFQRVRRHHRNSSADNGVNPRDAGPIAVIVRTVDQPSPSPRNPNFSHVPSYLGRFETANLT